MRLQPRYIDVNGTPWLIYSHLQKPSDESRVPQRCDNLNPDNGYCGIHENVPLSCDLPLITFSIPSNPAKPTRVNSRKMSRGWNMRIMDGTRGALCQIEDKPEDLEHGRKEAVRKFKRMLTWVSYLGIDTHLPAIIAWCETQPVPRTTAEFSDPGYLT